MATLLTGLEKTKRPESESLNRPGSARTGQFKVDYASNAPRGLRRFTDFTNIAKYPKDNSNLHTAKGQLFIVVNTPASDGASEEGKVTVSTIQENYFSYPTDDIAFSLQRAFDIANRKAYQMADAESASRSGVSCSALVLKDRYAYFAHIGNCRIYRISFRRIEQLTQDHLRVIRTMDDPEQAVEDVPGAHRTWGRTMLTRSLGVQLGTRVDTMSKIPIHRDEYFLLCDQEMSCINELEIKSIVLSSSPQGACAKLTELARERGAGENLAVQVVKIYNQYDQPSRGSRKKSKAPKIETYSHVSSISSRWINWPVYLLLFLMLAFAGFLSRDMFHLENLWGMVTPTKSPEIPRNTIILNQLEAAEAFIEKGNFKEAVQNYQSVLFSIDSTNQAAIYGLKRVAEEYRRQAEGFVAKKHFYRARDSFNAALELVPGDAELIAAIRACDRRIQRIEAGSAAYRNSNESRIPPSEIKIIEPPETLPQSSITEVNPGLWFTPGLTAGADYVFNKDGVTFKDNVRAKKVFFVQSFDSIEVEIQANAISGESSGKYGLIFGHVAEAGNTNQSFYVFSVNNLREFRLERVAGQSIKELLANQVTMDVAERDFASIHLKVKCGGQLILLYVNGVMVHMYRAETPVMGGVGFYGDSKLAVTLSDFKVTPARIR